MSDMKIKLTLSADDGASKVLAKSMQALQKSQLGTEKAASSAAAATARANAQATKAAQTRTTAAQAAGTLGIRTERQVQAEILRTQRAYQKMQRSGKASANDLARGYSAMTNKVRTLNSEIGRMSRAQKAMNTMRAAGIITAGVAGAAAVVANPVRKAMAFDDRARKMANLSHGGRNVTHEQYTAAVADTKIRAETSAQKIGVSKDEALQVMHQVTGDNHTLSGDRSMADQVSARTEMALKASIATGADALDAAKFVKELEVFLQGGDANKAVSDEDLQRGLDMAIASGVHGTSEFADSVGDLPNALAAAKGSYQGIDQLGSLFATYQTMANGAGANSEAASSQISGTLKQINDPMMAKAFDDIFKVDLAASLDKSMLEHGTTRIEAFAKILNEQIDKHKDYKDALAKVNADPAQRTDQENATLATAKEKILSKFLKEGNEQGTLVIMNNLDMLAKVRDEVRQEDGITDRLFTNVAEGDAHKSRAGTNVLSDSLTTAIEPLAKAYGEVMATIKKYAEAYPELTQNITLAATALASLAAVAASAAFAYALIGGKGIFGRNTKPPDVPKPIFGSGSGAIQTGKGAVSKVGSFVARNLGPIIAAALTANDMLNTQGRTDIDQPKKNEEHGKSVGWIAGALGGWEAGALATNGMPNPLVKLAGALGGSIMGALIGSQMGGDIVNFFQGRASDNHRETGIAATAAKKAMYEKYQQEYEDTLDPEQLAAYRATLAKYEAGMEDSPTHPYIPNIPTLRQDYDPAYRLMIEKEKEKQDVRNEESRKWQKNHPYYGGGNSTGESGIGYGGRANGNPRIDQSSSQVISDINSKISELTSQVMARELVVNITGIMDGNEIFRGVERIMVNQLNRGA